jgi:hypothetical protein
MSGEILVFLVCFPVDRDSPADTTGVFATGARAPKKIKGLWLTDFVHILSPVIELHYVGVDHALHMYR